jgi:hypothetical protein
VTAPPAVAFVAPGPAQLVGALLTLWSVRTVLQSQSAATEGGRAARALGALVWLSARCCARLGVLAGRADPTSMHVRLAVAPRSAVARMVVAGSRAAMRRALKGRGPGVLLPLPPPIAEVLPGVRAVAAVATTIFLAPTVALLDPLAAVLVLAMGSVVGTRLPELVLSRAAHQAIRVGADGSAAALELLTAQVAIGVPLQAALERTATHAPAAVAAALRAAALRASAGTDPAGALAGEGERHGIHALRDVGGAVDRARRLGAPLAVELRRITAGLRAEERARLGARAARRGPLATLVVALVIAPLCVAGLVACLVGGLLEGGATVLR